MEYQWVRFRYYSVVKVAIIGQGYVGTAVGVSAHKAGHNVVGIDISTSRVRDLQCIGYQVESNFSDASDSDIVILAVPTPLNEAKLPDLSFLENACNSLKSVLNRRTLIINESTSYPGTVRNTIFEILGPNHLYVAAPERVDPANVNWNVSNTPRVIGGLTEEANKLGRAFYETFVNEVHVVSTPEIAEASKLMENTFRQVNIALANEFAKIAIALEIPILETLDSAATKPFGFMKFLPSLGVGGHCIPIDPLYLSYVSQRAGVEAKLINLANDINASMPEYVFHKLIDRFDILNTRIQIIGISYKANVNDVRESPAIKLMEILREYGCQVDWHDPLVKSFARETSSELGTADLNLICALHDCIDFRKLKLTNSVTLNLSTNYHEDFESLFSV